MIKRYLHNTFSSLKIHNYRLYFFGQIISVSGSFMQQVAQGWLVLKLTNSGQALGIVLGLQYLPILLFGPMGGVIADRFNKRKLILLTRIAFCLLAFVLGFLVYTGWIRLWMLYIISFCYGITNAVDNPTRHTFVIEMVGKEHLRNAITLYTSAVNMARIIGPTIGGALIVWVGLTPCFFLNGISYFFVIAMIFFMKKQHLFLTPREAPSKGQIAQGLRYIKSNHVLFHILFMMAIVGTLTYEFQVSIPLFAKFTFAGNATAYGLLLSALGLGGVIGGLLSASQKHAKPFMYVIASLLFGTAVFITSQTSTIYLAFISMIFVGMCSILFTSLGNTLLQLESKPEMRGRVMSLWSIAYMGSTALGGPIVGWIGETAGARLSLVTGGVAAIIAGIWGLIFLVKSSNEPQVG